ncbi:MAG: hypothetical protein CL822_00160 [Crocinitomicaceae bacterium]|nr:hypothetical protein [Crocinitomicaceae bacterium]
MDFEVGEVLMENHWSTAKLIKPIQYKILWIDCECMGIQFLFFAVLQSYFLEIWLITYTMVHSLNRLRLKYQLNPVNLLNMY